MAKEYKTLTFEDGVQGRREMAQEIDVERAKEAHERAKKAMQEAEMQDDVDYVALQAELQRAANRMKVGNKYKNLPQAKQ